MVKRRESLNDATVINSNLDLLLQAEKPVELHPPEYAGAITINKSRDDIQDEERVTLLVGPTESESISFWREDGNDLQIYDAEASTQRRFALARPIGQLTMVRHRNLWVASLDGDNIVNREGVISFVNRASFRARVKSGR